ncbi:MAG: aldo/keto reductase [Candidatus Aminicenantes bacterium]|nr:MAG: aldo/keto reductase [Candidatus Aminicenantes bacterium]
MENKRLDRRRFLKTGILGLAGTAAGSAFLNAGSAGSRLPLVEKEKFIYRTLGKTGIKLPIVSMGVMNAENPNLVAAALDSGIILLDTAHGYQKGKNEEMIGGVIKDRNRDSFVLATKVAYQKDRKTGLYPTDKNVQSFEDEFNISLKRLGMDYVDILYIHSFWVRETVTFEPALKFLDKVKKEGKARFVGFTTHRNEHEMLDAAVECGIYDVVLTAYNFRQKNKGEIGQAMSRATKAGMGIVAMKTQAGVYWDKERQEPINMKAALKWALQNENVHTSIPGYTAFDQMELDLSVMEDLTLTPKERADLKLDEGTALAGLYCQQCGTCERQCPSKVDIPTLMRSYMYAYGYKNLSLAHSTIQDLGARIPCSDCSSCHVLCPNGFDVPKKVQDIIRLKAIPQEFLG